MLQEMMTMGLKGTRTLEIKAAHATGSRRGVPVGCTEVYADV
jgi:hypothetical protein